MLIYILNRDFVEVDVIEGYTSFIWTERFDSLGDFELHMSTSEARRHDIDGGTALSIKNSKRIMVVETIKEVSENDTVVYTGRSLESILEIRVARLPYSGSPKTKMYSGVKQAMIDGTYHSVDKLPNFSVGTNVLYPASTIAPPVYPASEGFPGWHDLHSPHEDSNIGYRIVREFGDKNLYYDNYTGNDRSVPDAFNVSDTSLAWANPHMFETDEDIEVWRNWSNNPGFEGNYRPFTSYNIEGYPEQAGVEPRNVAVDWSRSGRGLSVVSEERRTSRNTQAVITEVAPNMNRVFGGKTLWGRTFTLSCKVELQSVQTNMVAGSNPRGVVVYSGGLGTYANPIINTGPGVTLANTRYEAFPSATVLDSGRIVATWCSYETHYGPGHAKTSYSDDGGSTWTTPQQMIAGVTHMGAVGLASMGNRVAALHMSLDTPERSGWIQISSNQGVTWGTAVEITGWGNEDWVFPSDLLWHDNGTTDGLMLVTSYGPDGIILMASTDAGATWSKRANVIKRSVWQDTTETAMVLLPNGELLMSMRNDTTVNIELMRSTDMGYTWSDPTVIFTQTSGLPRMTRTDDGVILMTLRDQRSGVTPLQGWVTGISVDEGRTWTRNRWIDERMMYGMFVQRNDGRVMLVGASDQRSASLPSRVWCRTVNTAESRWNREIIATASVPNTVGVHDLSVTFTVPPESNPNGDNRLTILLTNRNGDTDEGVIFGDFCVVEHPSNPVGYFDGSYSPDEDLLPQWTAPEGYSQSILTGRKISGALVSDMHGCVLVQSKQWGSGGLSARMIKNSSSLEHKAILKTTGSSLYFQVSQYQEELLTGTNANFGRVYLRQGANARYSSPAKPNTASSRLVSASVPLYFNEIEFHGGHTKLGGSLYFDLLVAATRSGWEPQENEAVIFSEGLESFVVEDSRMSIDEYRSVAYVTHGTTLVQVDDGYADSPVNRRIIWVDANDLEDDQNLLVNMEEAGKKALLDNPRSFLIDGSVPSYSPYVYDQDYYLGDIVMVQNRMGRRVTARVVEQIFVSDSSGFQTYPTLREERSVGLGTWFAPEYNIIWSSASGLGEWNDQP